MKSALSAKMNLAGRRGPSYFVHQPIDSPAATAVYAGGTHALVEVSNWQPCNSSSFGFIPIASTPAPF